jgi:ubiquinone/menaquinone biosynthesis C-methylase UbiE
LELQEYHSIFKYEEKHWWYAGLRAIVRASLARFLKTSSDEASVLDAGCGAGKLLEEFTRTYKGRSVGIDFSPTSLELCKKRKAITKLVNSSVSELPFKDESFDAVVSLDVLYHKGVASDVAALKEFKRVLKIDGIVILNLAAYDFLKGPHDEVVHTRERYTREKLRARLEAAGLTVERITYRNTLLFPLFLAVRTLQRLTSQKGGVSDLSMPSAPVNFALRAVVGLENAILSAVDLPFGSSVFCVARKTDK